MNTPTVRIVANAVRRSTVQMASRAHAKHWSTARDSLQRLAYGTGTPEAGEPPASTPHPATITATTVDVLDEYDDWRALSIRPPWSHLVAHGHKTVENRSWATPYRGPILIHASKTWERDGAATAHNFGLTEYTDRAHCTTGAYLGTVTLVDVHPAEGDCCQPWGDPDPHVYHWILDNPRPLPHPVPGRGRQRLYTVAAEELKASRRATTPGGGQR